MSVSKSSIEAEYCSLVNATSKVTRVKSLFNEFHVPFLNLPIVWCDNLSRVPLAANPVLHSKIKHVELDIHFVNERVLNKKHLFNHISSIEHTSYLFTKPLPAFQF